MRKKLVLLFLSSSFYFFSSTPTFAHFPATDGNMTVTMHVDPDDNPNPGQQANLYFLFDDETKRFQLSSCVCVVTISEQGKQLTEQRLIEKNNIHPSIWGTNMLYIFPKVDIYHITLSGKPITPNAFQSFDLSWDFRVDPDNSPGIVVKPNSDLPILLGATVIGIVFFGFFGWLIKKEILDAKA